ncbi:LamG-like jellyroll fold domain-containing protein [Chitinophaga filiformis]|uniref:DUF6443 domain-containing protein n=1 Tax=Chitinophaga filiformis TaxID=104663 RepID=A0ABY4I945_CHIFI|nr:LamG-like jellyroll fold domain-containing protein [Chitinophaga filiformis]UPK72618.1 hypothetical protein MYF79_15095 [Chitinophaga filiformis]
MRAVYARILMLKVIMIACLLCGMSQARAFNAIETYQNQLQGAIKKGDTLLLKDEKFLNSAFDWQKIHNKSVNNIIIFGLYRDPAVVLPKAFKCEIDLKVEYWSGPDQVEPSVDDHVKLAISFDPAAGVAYQDATSHRFQYGYKVRITVNDITSAELGAPLPAAFSLRTQVVVERSYDIDQNTGLIPVITRQQSTGSEGAPVEPHAVSLSWNTITGAEEYDVEWTFIDEESYNGRKLDSLSTNVTEDVLKKMFRNNASRATVQKEQFDISLVHNSRFLLIRIRLVQYQDNDFRQEGSWHYQIRENGITKPGVIDLADNSWHQDNLNWQYNAVYAEDGKKKEVVSYFDGTLRNRQTVTVNNSDKTAVVQETIYDEFGRPLASILPAPTSASVLKYYPEMHLSDTGKYNFRDIYGIGGKCINIPAPLSNQKGAARYYSPLNEFKDDTTRPENRYIPDAEGYPLAVTRYTGDNTGRVSVQGGVGKLFQPGPANVSKATRYFYGKPEQWELDRLFGNDVGYASHYLKNMTIDGNGQISVSYQDATGKTIATALTGDTPGNLDSLSSKPAAVQTTTVVMNREFSFDPSKMKISATATYMSAVAGKVTLTLDIQQLISKYAENNVSICSNCYYEGNILISDNCGNVVFQNATPMKIGSMVASCDEEVFYSTRVDTIGMDVGEYFITFELGIPEAAVNSYARNYVAKNSNLKKEWTFVSDVLFNKDFLSCFNDCATCKESLGELTDFSQRIRERLLADSVKVPANDTTLATWINNLYASLSSQCAELRATCRTSTPCTDLENVMKRDVSPGGQYALFDDSLKAVEPTINVLNLNWRQVFKPLPKDSLRYIQEQFELEDGTLTSPYDSAFTLQLLAKYWKSDWATNFVQYHPEYCALKFCWDNASYLQWDEQVRTLAKTVAEIPANAKGAVYNRDSIRWLVDHDPFFSDGGKGHDFMAAFIDDLTNYSKNVAGAKKDGTPVGSLSKFVDYMLYCADYTGTTNANNNAVREADNWSGCAPKEECRIPDREWALYREKYLELKDKYYQLARNTSAYCGDKCTVGAAQAYLVTDCPDVFKFILEKDANPCSAGYIARVTYLGQALTKSMTLNIYYPDEYRNLIIGSSQVSIPAGVTSTGFCVNKAIPLSALRIAAVNCGTAVGDTVFSCAVDAREDKFERLTYAYDGTKSKVSYTYRGHIPPVGAAIRALVSWDPVDWETAQPMYIDHDYDRHAFVIEAFGQINNWVLKIDTCYDASQHTGNGCNQAYAYKTSRITNINYTTSPITTDTTALKGVVNDAMVAMINQNCEAQADVWMGNLSGLLDSLKYVGKKSIVRAKLIEVCKLGGDAEHMNGASTIPAGRAATAEGYRSFADVLKGVLGISYNMDYNPYLIDAPYPYDVQPQAVERVLNATDGAICDRLATLTAEYNAAQTGDSFYVYLTKKYGAAMNISKEELQFLQKGCTNCRYLLQRPVKLPVFMEKGAKGCITASEYTDAVVAFVAVMGDSLIVDHPNYERMFANSLNSRFGFTLSYAEYKEYGDTLAKNPSLSLLLCNHPVYASVKQDNYECMMQGIDDAVTAGHVAYKEYIEEVKRLFRAEYIAYCSANKPKVSLTSPQQIYHYTLYYYDQAGNLVRTVPPEGVHPLDDSLFAQIAAVRRIGSAVCTYSGPTTNTPEATALQQFTTVFDRSGDASLEMWMFNQSRSGGQVVATTSGNKYIFNLCISGKYLNFDVYTVTPLAGGEADVVLSAHTTADLTGILPLTPWTHVVIQGDGLKKNGRDIYVNGKSCPRVTVEPTGACPWEIRSGSAGITYPKNLTLLKQVRFFNRKLSAKEISANADDACMGFSPSYATALDSAKLFWTRFGIPAAGSYWTVDGGTTETQYVPVYPKHTLMTSYAYQSLNGIEAQKTPDAGVSRFWYDMLGRMVASQNAEQLSPLGGGLSSRYSYTNYDGQGRIKEVGETQASLPLTAPFLSTDALALFGANPKQQVTRTYYDAPKPQTADIIANAQDNLRKRVSAVTYGEDANGIPEQATYYTYDQIGNVKTLWQQMAGLNTKQIDYQYDLVSGKVNKVRYQSGNPDQFLYGYEYDAENRLTKAYTGVNTVSSNGWVIETPHTDAAYRYYLHGPLARTELGNEQLVQGIDYAYTLQGWLKGVNGNYLSPQDEIGRDGVKSTWRSNIARDAYGYSLEYFKGDYNAISDQAKAFPLKWTVGVPTEAGRDLFNGNISRSTLALKRVAEQAPVGYSYRYDQLSRLKGMRQHSLSVGATDWSAATAGEQFKEAITYDANGNILSYLRNGSNGKGLAMDQLSYVYSRDAAGNLLNNKLSQVVDNASDASYTEDLKTQPANNYLYDNIGNLLSDKQGKIDSVRWTLYGKIRQIGKTDGSSLEYAYDPAGNRVYKKYTTGTVGEKTWYVRDAQGNVLAVYGKKDSESQTYWKEQHLYGSSRLGIWTSDIDVTVETAAPSDTNWLKKGRKQYELTNHLGNVLATISDKVVDSVIGNSVDHYEAEVLSAQDYYPFGMLQPDRKWSLGRYRYGFNGQEKSTEVGTSNYTAQFWEYDSRIGRRWNLDPVNIYFESRYSTFHNNPNLYSDPFGLYGSKRSAERMRDRARRAGLDAGDVYYRKDQKDWVFGETKSSSRKEAAGGYSVEVTSKIHSEGRYFGGIGRRIKDFLSDWNPVKSVEGYVGTVVKKEVSIERAGLPVKFVVPLFGGQIKWRSDRKEPEYKLIDFTSGYVNGKFAGADFRIMPLEGALGGDYVPGYRALYPIAKGPILVPVGEMTIPVGEWKIQADAATNFRDLFIGARGVAETGGDGVPLLGIPKTGVKVEVNGGYRFRLKWPNIVNEYFNEE